MEYVSQWDESFLISFIDNICTHDILDIVDLYVRNLADIKLPACARTLIFTHPQFENINGLHPLPFSASNAYIMKASDNTFRQVALNEEQTR